MESDPHICRECGLRIRVVIELEGHPSMSDYFIFYPEVYQLDTLDQEKVRKTVLEGVRQLVRELPLQPSQIGS